MKSAIVLKPGQVDKRKEWFFVVVNVPTIDVAISYTPVRLAELNVFQKGVAYFLLAGVHRVDAIVRLMGVTDEDFIILILSELVMHGYARAMGEREFVPTTKLESEFSKTNLRAESRRHEVVAFIRSGNRDMKIAGPIPVHVATSEVVSTATGTQISVGTEGKPQQVECFVSDIELPITNKVDRAVAKEWIIGQPSGSERYRSEALSTQVEILVTKSRPFVLQVKLKEDFKSRSLPNNAEQLRSALLVKFAGEKEISRFLALHLSEIAGKDGDFFDAITTCLRTNRNEVSVANSGAVEDPQFGNDVEVVETVPNHQQTRKGTQKKRPLQGIVEILVSRLSLLGTARLEPMLVYEPSIQGQVSARLVAFGSGNRKPVVPPLPTIQLEAIVARQLHDELDVAPVLAAWILLEDNQTLNELTQLNDQFIDGLCDIFLNPYVEAGKDMRATFKYLGSKGK